MWRPAHPGTQAHCGLESSVGRQDTFQLLADENLNNAPKNVRKSQNLPVSIHTVVSARINIAKIWLSLYFMGCARIAWHCGLENSPKKARALIG